MESPILKQGVKTLSPSNSGRRRSSDSNSPEFEFWMVRNPSFPQPNILSADELFVDGVLLPLHLLHPPDTEPPNNSELPPNPKSELDLPIPDSESEQPVPNSETEPRPGPELSAESPTGFNASKRWMDIFKKSDKKTGQDKEKDKDKDKDKEKKKERSKSQTGTSSAELNINIWPFSRSRSAGNNANRPRMAAGGPVTRKVSSAPCSRSNSAGESKSRKWPSSPSRPGVHLGRSSPVWQVRRGGSGMGIKPSEPVVRNVEKGSKKEGSDVRRNKTASASAPAAASAGGSAPKARVLNLNVPMCIGYRHHLSCRSDENSAIGVATGRGGGIGGTASNGAQAGGGGGGGSSSSGGNLFNFRNLFTKKVY